MERLTTQFPELAARVRQAVNPGVESFVLDSELVAYDKGKYQPFQVLS